MKNNNCLSLHHSYIFLTSVFNYQNYYIVMSHYRSEIIATCSSKWFKRDEVGPLRRYGQ